MFQKRWVKFDGDSISYYNNEKVSAMFGSKCMCIRQHLEITISEHLC